jgi:hypothetical protein
MMIRTCSTLRENDIQDFSRTSEEKKPLERPSHRWELNTKVDVKETGFERWTLLR